MLKYLKKYWFFALLAPIFMIGEVSMDLLQPELMSRIIDDRRRAHAAQTRQQPKQH